MSGLSGLPVTVVRACLRGAAGGSPTAVVDDRPWLSDDDRRRVPARAGASHAVFLGPDDGHAPVCVRFFTAGEELPACGHGTIAAIARIAARTPDPDRPLTLRAPGGHDIPAWARRRGDLYVAGFAAGTVGLREPGEAELTDVTSALGVPLDAYTRDARVATLGRPRILVPVATRSALAALRPDMPALKAACLRHDLLGCYVHTLPAGGTGGCAARMFAPAIGVPEDIANANSTACLAARLCAAAPDGVTVDMGDALGSPATITARAASADASPLVHAGGTATMGRALVLT